MCIRNIFNNTGKMNESRSSQSNHGSSPTHAANATTAAPVLLPQYLSHLVRHYHDDFYISRSFETQLIVQLMAEGFLPIATRGYLLPKLHIERCILQLNPQSKLHISRSTRKKSKSFLLSVNECFDAVVAGCHRQQ
jgi:Leu/Phe-tRNA-protein transferase